MSLEELDQIVGGTNVIGTDGRDTLRGQGGDDILSADHNIWYSTYFCFQIGGV